MFKINNKDSSMPQTYHVYPTLKRRGNGRFHVVSTRNTCGVFVGIIVVSEHISHLYYVYI